MTLSPIGAAALLPPRKPIKSDFKIKKEQGKGTTDHLMSLGNWFYFLITYPFWLLPVNLVKENLVKLKSTQLLYHVIRAFEASSYPFLN